MTTLRGLRNKYWTDENSEDIRTFFRKSKLTILAIFFEGRQLTCSFDFPTYPVQEFTYFIKQFGQAFTPVNFQDEIIFGTISQPLEAMVLNLLENFFFPTLSSETTLPENILLPKNFSFRDFRFLK